eukprot:COSAG01_NODE_1459_length_10250_cov_5.016846_2_plen_390_part_00
MERLHWTVKDAIGCGDATRVAAALADIKELGCGGSAADEGAAAGRGAQAVVAASHGGFFARALIERDEALGADVERLRQYAHKLDAAAAAATALRATGQHGAAEAALRQRQRPETPHLDRAMAKRGGGGGGGAGGAGGAQGEGGDSEGVSEASVLRSLGLWSGSEVQQRLQIRLGGQAVGAAAEQGSGVADVAGSGGEDGVPLAVPLAAWLGGSGLGAALSSACCAAIGDRAADGGGDRSGGDGVGTTSAGGGSGGGGSSPGAARHEPSARRGAPPTSEAFALALRLELTGAGERARSASAAAGAAAAAAAGGVGAADGMPSSSTDTGCLNDAPCSPCSRHGASIPSPTMACRVEFRDDMFGYRLRDIRIRAGIMERLRFTCDFEIGSA